MATSWPSTRPTRTLPTGPSNGIELIDSAAEAAMPASTSGSF